MPADTHLSPEQSSEFEDRGVLRLPKFYSKAEIGPMSDRLWAYLAERHGMHRDRPETWTIAHPAQFQALRRSGAFDALGSPKLLALANAVLGDGNWEKPRVWGGPLVTFPTPVPSPDYSAWHLDISGASFLEPMPVMRTFTFCEPVRPHGGGTLYVAGSHQLAIALEREKGEPVRSKEVCASFAERYPWFRQLLASPTADLHDKMHAETEIGGLRLRLEEMTGEPGDLILMHPAILHGVGHNGLDRPRLMLTEWLHRRQ